MAQLSGVPLERRVMHCHLHSLNLDMKKIILAWTVAQIVNHDNCTKGVVKKIGHCRYIGSIVSEAGI